MESFNKGGWMHNLFDIIFHALTILPQFLDFVVKTCSSTNI
jgi:hypothetical protein